MSRDPYRSENAMSQRYTVMTFVGPGSILWTDHFEMEPGFDEKPAAWTEAKARVADHPEEITVPYIADGSDRSAVWTNRPDIVLRTAA